jgi:hypothetical protein
MLEQNGDIIDLEWHIIIYSTQNTGEGPLKDKERKTKRRSFPNMNMPHFLSIYNMP